MKNEVGSTDTKNQPVSEANDSERLKRFYTDHHDAIFSKRYNSPYPIRQAVHRSIYDSVIELIPPSCRTLLDAGCGEGTLSILLAQRGYDVTGLEISRPNIEAAESYALAAGLSEKLKFVHGDAGTLAFPDNHFDCIVSNHVLEHLADFEQGVREIYRVTRESAVVAVPTCLSLCSLALLGGDSYWKISRRTPVAIPWAVLRVATALFSGADGVNEGYAGSKDNIHIFRFPWVVSRILRRCGFEIQAMHGQTFHLPYLPYLSSLNRLRKTAPFCYLGLGTVFLLRKQRAS